MKAPPDTIDGAEVIEWAWSDEPFGVVPFTDGSGAIAIHGLAICRYTGDIVYRFSCDARWQTAQDMDYESVEEAKSQLPAQYRNVPIYWVKAA